jgi:YD repeat-containing protein
MRLLYTLLISLGFFQLDISGAEGAEKNVNPAPVLPSYWVQVEAGLGGMNLFGTLRINYPLGDVKELKILGTSFSLEHLIEIDANGCGRSTWRLTGLRTSLVPSGRQHLRWLPLRGVWVGFERVKIGHALEDAGDPRWLIREVAEGEYEIRSLDGRGWHYKHGSLTSAEHPALGTVRFITHGGLVCEMRLADALSDSPALLKVEYDENARFISLSMAGQEAHRFIWNSTGQLIAWKRPDGVEVRYGYSNGLLSEITETGKAPRVFKWAENPGYGSGDSRWIFPVHLAADEHSDYTYDISSKGFILTRLDRSTCKITTTIFNPRRRRLEQQTRNASWVVFFRKGNAGGIGGLESIATGSGELLEEYRYDEKGQLIGLKRKGEADRTLRYDESGRLMALDEGQILP